MILRTLATSLKQRDWGGAFIDVLIVVIGILLALQADDWVSERNDRAAETAALQRLLDEAEEAVDYIRDEVAYQERMNALRRQATAIVDGELAVPEQDLPLRIGINTMLNIPNLSTARTTYDELTSAGQMQLIRSHAVRRQIALFYAALDYFRSHVSRPNVEGFWEGYFRHVSYAYNPAAETSDVILSTYDWDGIRADPGFVSRLIGALRNQLAVQEMRLDLLRMAEQMCAAIASELDTTCQPPSLAQ